MDFAIRPGESLTIDSTVTNADGSPRDLTDATLTFLVYLSPSKPDFSEDDPVVLAGASDVVSGPEGTVVSYLTPEATVGMAFSILYYEIQLTEVDETVTTIESGKLTIGSL